MKVHDTSFRNVALNILPFYFASSFVADAYRGGKEGLLGFFVGQVLKESGGNADPRVVGERLREKLAR